MGYCGYECKCGNIILINNSWENYVCECPECNTEYLCNNGTVLLVQHPKTVYNCNEDMEKEIEYDDTTSKQMLQKKEQVGLIYNTADIFDYIRSFNVHEKLLILVQNNMIFKSFLQKNGRLMSNRSLFVAAENMIIILRSQ